MNSFLTRWIQKRIVAAATIWWNTVYTLYLYLIRRLWICLYRWIFFSRRRVFCWRKLLLGLRLQNPVKSLINLHMKLTFLMLNCQKTASQKLPKEKDLHQTGKNNCDFFFLVKHYEFYVEFVWRDRYFLWKCMGFVRAFKIVCR